MGQSVFPIPSSGGPSTPALAAGIPPNLTLRHTVTSTGTVTYTGSPQAVYVVVVGGGAGGRDEFVGVIAVVCPAVVHGIFIRIQGVGEFESIAIGVGVAVGDGSTF